MKKPFEANVRCPHCGCEFRACIHSDHHPNAGERYEVNCPSHGGPFEFVIAGSKDFEREVERDRLIWGEPFTVFSRSLQQVENKKRKTVIAKKVGLSGG